MEHDASHQFKSAAPVPEIPIKRSNNIILIVILIILTISISVSITYFLLTRQPDKKYVIPNQMPLVSTPVEQIILYSPVATASVGPVTSCGFADSSFCEILGNMKDAITSKNTQAIYSYLLTQSITCDPDGMVVPICDGVAKGTVKSGYMLGYVDSEGAIYSESQAIAIVNSYINSEAVIYHGARQEQDRSMIVFLSSDKLKILAFPFNKSEGKWKMNHILLGKVTDDFLNLKDALLGM